MKLFCKQSDGGKNSGVTAYTLIEWKRFFSVMLLHFRPGTREAYHSHAFNAWTYFIKGRVYEERIDHFGPWSPRQTPYKAGQWKKTTRENMHRVNSIGHTWALTFRGPWSETWKELKWENGRPRYYTLTHGRKVVSVTL